jgi:hypothetical protein
MIGGAGYVGLVTGDLPRAKLVITSSVWINNEQKVADADFGLVKEFMHSPINFDGRNQLDREMLVEIGFDYYGIGR